MKNIVAFSVITLLLVVVTWFYIQNQNYTQIQSKTSNQTTQQGSLSLGTYEFPEVASELDPNGETFSSWKHTIKILDENIFEYSVDGRMAMVRVRGTFKKDGQTFRFVTKENFLTEDGSEPFPQFDLESELFTVRDEQNSNALNVTWQSATANLPENSETVTFLKVE